MNINRHLKNKDKFFVILLAHLFNDWYMNYIQTLLPFMIIAGLSLSKGAFLVSAFTITSSLLQPVFGYLVDKKNQKWMVFVGTVWMALLISMIGIANNYFLLVILASLAGLGTAAFHPQSSAMITALSPRQKGLAQSIFIAAGNMGWALTPLMVVPFVQKYGLELTPVFALPGIFVALLLFLFTKSNQNQQPPLPSRPVLAPQPPSPILPSSWMELTKVISIVAFRSLAYFGLITFLPLYFQNKGLSLLMGSQLIFIMLFAGALGGLSGGYLSDIWGRKFIIVTSLVISGFLFYSFLNFSGILGYLLLALAGAALLASFPVTVVVAQEIIPKNAALASGLTLGFSIGIGGLGVGLVGILAERIGIVFTIDLLIWLPVLAGILALSLKGNREKSNLLAGLPPSVHRQ